MKDGEDDIDSLVLDLVALMIEWNHRGVTPRAAALALCRSLRATVEEIRNPSRRREAVKA